MDSSKWTLGYLILRLCGFNYHGSLVVGVLKWTLKRLIRKHFYGGTFEHGSKMQIWWKLLGSQPAMGRRYFDLIGCRRTFLSVTFRPARPRHVSATSPPHQDILHGSGQLGVRRRERELGPRYATNISIGSATGRFGRIQVFPSAPSRICFTYSHCSSLP